MSDFDAVTMLGYQIVAAISGVQSARLLETSPKGWQSSGSLEDKNYSKTLEAIQKDDFTPILELHFKLLAKSRFGIDKKYTVIFDPIDNPTEKEQAEIREINSRTDATYINAGVVSAEEVRGVLRADENSGYNALSEEMEGEPLPDDEDDPFDMGGSPNEQAPFSMDEWITVHPNGKEHEGQPLFVEEGETKKEAINRKYGEKDKNNFSNENYEAFSSGGAGNKFFKQDKNYSDWNKTLSDDEKNAIFLYSGYEYRNWNTALREEKEEKLNKKTRTRIEKLDNVINKFNLSKPIKVYRAVEPEIANKITKTFQDKAFLSTSLDKKSILHHDLALIEINIPKGKGLGAYINEHSIYKNKEYEFLLKRNSKFNVTSKRKENGRTIITMDLIPD